MSSESKIAVPSNDDDPRRWDLRVKKEHVRDARPASLPPLPEVSETDARETPKSGDSRDRKGNRRQNKKKRPRDKRIDDSSKLCLAYVRGEECPYGDKCRFSHDLKAYMASRPEDIKTFEEGCPQFNIHGKCQFGAMCRLGSSHVNLATGENLTKEVAFKPKPILNILSRDVQSQLRKKKYPFVTMRNDVKSKKNVKPEHSSTTAKEESKDAPPQPPAADLAPLPVKERKLIDFSGKVYVAPLTTLGNLPFRRVMKKLGADITCGEMAVAVNLLSGQPSEWALLKRHPDEDIFGVQLAAGFPDVFGRACELIENEMEVDFVDLNLGCPLDILCDKGAGAALMQRDRRIKDIVSVISNILSCPFSIKMRTGWDMTKPFAHELVPKIQSWGIDGIAAIMVHGRSRLQRYSKLADWDYISKVSKSQDNEKPLIPLIGNGDIYTYQDYEDKIAREGLSSCAMLGRGALVKPWLPTEIKERRNWDISATERLDILKDFVKFGLEHWGTDQQGLNNCRRFLLEWLSFLHRYCPIGLLEEGCSQHLNLRPPVFIEGRNDLETLFLSSHSSDWIKVSEMLLGPVPEGFRFEPKHKAKGYQS